MEKFELKDLQDKFSCYIEQVNKGAPDRKEAVFTELYERIALIRRNLRKISTRLNGECLTIAVAGPQRQGKSRLLQSITGLNDMQIPTSAANTCTSVQSMIVHYDNDTPYAKVSYHDSEAFIDKVVHPIYDTLRWPGEPIRTLEDFKRDFSLREVPQTNSDRNVYEILKECHVYLDEINREIFLPRVREQKINIDEVRKYVTYDINRKVSSPTNLAISNVEVRCRFPEADFSNIAVVDLPGMDALTEERDKEILRGVLSDMVDFIIFVSIPRRGGLSNVETKLFDMATKCMASSDGEGLKERAFYVANQFAGEVNDALNEILRKDFERGKVPVARYLTVDVVKPEEVRAKLMDPLINYLIANLPRLDLAHIDGARKDVADMAAALRSLLEDITGEYLNVNPGSVEYKTFMEEFDKVYRLLAGSLTVFVNGMEKEFYIDETNDSKKEFQKSVSEISDRCRKDLRSWTEEDKMNSLAAITPGGSPAVFYDMLPSLRHHISSDFSVLTDSCTVIVENAKDRLVAVLKKEGKLENIIELRDKNGSDFLSALCRMAGAAREARNLESAIKFLADYRLTYQGFFGYRVRKSLGCLRSSSDGLQSINAAMLLDVKGVIRKLRTLGDQAIDDVEVSLYKNSAKEQGEIIFAILESFVDSVLRSENIRKEWQDLYELKMTEIWPQHFMPGTDNVSLGDVAGCVKALKERITVQPKINDRGTL